MEILHVLVLLSIFIWYASFIVEVGTIVLQRVITFIILYATFTLQNIKKKMMFIKKLLTGDMKIESKLCVKLGVALA